MLKKILLILLGLTAIPICLLFIATTLRKPVIPDQYCKKVYGIAKQCVPGCVWQFHEPEFHGFVMEKESQPFIPQGETSCDGRIY